MPKRDATEMGNDSALIGLQNAITSIFQDVESGVDDEIEAIRNQIVQIQQLLIDAIASLYDSFENLNAHTTEQMELMSKLMFETVGQSQDVLDGDNIFQRTETASKVLRDLVEMIIEGSEEMLGALTIMDDLKPQMKGMSDELQHSDRLLSEMTRLVEAEGENRAELVALIDQVKQNQLSLKSNIKEIRKKNTAAHRHVARSAKKDIKDVYEARSSVEQLLKHLYGINDMVSNCRSKVTNVNGVIRQDLGKAVRALQFEDIVSQSLGHTELHLNRMFTFVGKMSQGILGMQQVSGDDFSGYMEQLKQLQKDVTTYRQELRLEDINPVSQQNMDEGDVDLF